jgi:hypothetical protein
MAATADKTDLVSRIKALEAKVDTLTRRGLFPMAVSNNAGVNQIEVDSNGQLAIRTSTGKVILQTDPAGGMAYPWYPVPLMQTFTGITGPSATASFPNGNANGAFQQMGTPAIVLGNNWFAGYLPYVSHPRLQLQTLCETASLGGTATWRAAISTDNFAHFTTIGTWVENQFNGNFTTNVFDISPYLGLTNVGFVIQLTAFTGGAGDIAMQPYGCFMRGTV